MDAGSHELTLTVDGVELAGTFGAVANPFGIVAFAHGTGSSRFSPRNQIVAGVLNSHGLATLLLDLLTAEEEEAERTTAHLRFDIEMLARRMTDVVRWMRAHDALAHLPVGLFGASTGAAAALIAAANEPEAVRAVVSRGGRPDLAASTIPAAQAPTLLIVGGDDHAVVDLNRGVLELFTVEASLEIIPGATHLFSEPGALDRVADLAAAWFRGHLRAERE